MTRSFILLSNYGFGWRKLGIKTSTMEDMVRKATAHRNVYPGDDLCVDLDSEDPQECGRQAVWPTEKEIRWPM